ncbi:hypothetical protein KR52_03390 [Synechococcus sp. KORDI-52]|uniref:hypothetical protein n=1 Tax=Synechococcus sp. KORDI-52 TaxID=585425 RepID=UPI0004E065B3|nr:hypothetical protein [Synechococcus sp. KORDI-52]AII48201.1 hypothetical protein KR52_03390 [Synechococcus sp. KORDI-52]
MTSTQLDIFLSAVCEDKGLQDKLLQLREQAAERCLGGIDFAYIDSIRDLAKNMGYNISRLDLAPENTKLVEGSRDNQQQDDLSRLALGIHRCMIAPLRCGLAGCNQLLNDRGEHVSTAERQAFLNDEI